ncbi:hypothetical pox protein [Squirrelpox virus]|uniref:Hypothetical pox protein n=1 Tax=Squirrelpox virus TaxID=240426 RepID=Q1HTP4_9POXV|nr:hypothetical pox protein [Squirrelpox virus]ABD51492.1 W1R [Squirrelpox virus]CCD83323.1 hypothetical pox protein [Squirrelpox virus]
MSARRIWNRFVDTLRRRMRASNPRKAVSTSYLLSTENLASIREQRCCYENDDISLSSVSSDETCVSLLPTLSVDSLNTERCQLLIRQRSYQVTPESLEAKNRVATKRTRESASSVLARLRCCETAEECFCLINRDERLI